MIPLDRVEYYLWYLSLLLHAALFTRLCWLGLALRYKAFSLCLLLQIIRTLILLPLSPNTNVYAYVYIYSEPVLIACRVAVVLEIYGKVLSSYRGLSILGRGTLIGALAISGLVSVFTHLMEFDFTHERFQMLRAMHLVESTVYTTLLFFLFALAAFIIWYPTPLKKNIILYSFGYSLYFVGVAAAIYLRNLDASALTRVASTGRLVVTDAALLLWVVLVRKSWEEESGGVAIRFSAESQERLLSQLEALNRTIESPKKSS